MFAQIAHRCRALFAVLILVALPAMATAAFDWNIDHTGSVNDFFEIEAFHTMVTNTSATADVVTVTMVKNIPGDWVASLCEEEICYAPFILEIDLELDPGQTIELIIDVTPVTTAGIGSAHITLASANEPTDVQDATFSVLTSGSDVLVIPDGTATSSANLFSNAITAAGQTHAVWDPSAMGKASSADLSRFDTVVWAAGATVGALSTEDMDTITAYLAGGGRLLLSSQNLAFSYSDPVSPYYSATTLAWLESTFGVDYVSFSGSTDFVSDLDNSAIFYGASYNINGGDGANNNTTPDVIAALGNGTAALSFSGGGTAVVRSAQGTAKTVFTSFGIEGIASAAARADFMDKVLTWFASDATAVGDDLQPLPARRAIASPNPFNPQTALHFEITGAKAQPTVITIYDLQGRVVRRLYSGSLVPGPHRVTWNGRDDRDRNLATGVYLARVQIAEAEQIVKMTLAK